MRLVGNHSWNSEWRSVIWTRSVRFREQVDHRRAKQLEARSIDAILEACIGLLQREDEVEMILHDLGDSLGQPADLEKQEALRHGEILMQEAISPKTARPERKQRLRRRESRRGAGTTVEGRRALFAGPRPSASMTAPSPSAKTCSNIRTGRSSAPRRKMVRRSSSFIALNGTPRGPWRRRRKAARAPRLDGSSSWPTSRVSIGDASTSRIGQISTSCAVRYSQAVFLAGGDIGLQRWNRARKHECRFHLAGVLDRFGSATTAIDGVGDR